MHFQQFMKKEKKNRGRMNIEGGFSLVDRIGEYEARMRAQQKQKWRQTGRSEIVSNLS